MTYSPEDNLDRFRDEMTPLLQRMDKPRPRPQFSRRCTFQDAPGISSDVHPRYHYPKSPDPKGLLASKPLPPSPSRLSKNGLNGNVPSTKSHGRGSGSGESDQDSSRSSISTLVLDAPNGQHRVKPTRSTQATQQTQGGANGTSAESATSLLDWLESSPTPSSPTSSDGSYSSSARYYAERVRAAGRKGSPGVAAPDLVPNRAGYGSSGARTRRPPGTPESEGWTASEYLRNPMTEHERVLMEHIVRNRRDINHVSEALAKTFIATLVLMFVIFSLVFSEMYTQAIPDSIPFGEP